MPEIELHVNMHRNGPLFDGRANREVELARQDVEKELAEHASILVHERLARVLRHPTGYYESRVRAEQVGTRWAVTDGSVVYGPWLEGTSSRNRTTRFKGYATFRRIGALVNQQATERARRILDRHIRRLG